MKRYVITVDGLAGSGKTSISKTLAQRLGFVHFSTGLLYRVVGYLIQKSNADLQNSSALKKLINESNLSLKLKENSSIGILVNNQELQVDLYTPATSEITSRCSEIEVVRQELFQIQRQALPGQSLVAEGRDMGTVVFPDAELKFFIQASVETRVERRLAQMVKPEMQESERNSLKTQMEIEIIERDLRDSNRAISPTKAAQDATIIINEGQTLTQIVQSMYDLCAKTRLTS